MNSHAEQLTWFVKLVIQPVPLLERAEGQIIVVNGLIKVLHDRVWGHVIPFGLSIQKFKLGRHRVGVDGWGNGAHALKSIGKRPCDSQTGEGRK